MPIFVTEQIGPTQSLTPEGYLLCAGVPIARTGTQIYAAHELPELKAGRDGLITVIREENEVFRPETIASFEGKSITVNHTFVDPTNVKRVEVGHLQNVRRSESERDLLTADLLIKDERAIELVRFDPDRPERDIWRDLSCGYDADYVQVEPGVAYQTSIVGNHVAIVKRGRAGPRCSIQDEETKIMAAKSLSDLFSRMMRAARTGDAALIKKTADEVAEEELRMTDEAMKAKDEEIANLKKTVDELNEKLAEKEKTADDTPPDDEDKTKTADAMRDTASRAEVLVPGFTMPTADSVPNMAGVATVQQKVLSDAMKTEDGREIVTALLAGRTVDALTVDATASVFLAASEMMKQRNNSRGARQGIQTRDFGPAVTAAEINRRNSEFYAVK